MRVIIQNAHLRDGRGDHGAHDLYLQDGVIEGVNLGGKVDETFDAAGRLVTPAFIDLHAHLREPGQEQKEDLASGLAAAAAGGFGTVVSMANTTPPVDDPGVVASLIHKAERLGFARLRPAATLSRGLKGQELTDFAALKDAGAVMITDDGVPVADGHLMRRACEYALDHGLVIQTHSEDPGLRQNGVINEGVVSQRLGLPGNPVAAEAAMIYRDCEIAAMTGARVHIAHVSSKRGMQVVEFFRAQGAPITCEVTPHHLTLTDAVLETFDPIHKVAPPLRTAEDIAFLRDAVRRGVVDSIGTDHAPHTRAEKDRDMVAAPFGIGNIEVTFPLLYTELVEGDGLPLETLLHLLQAGPARVMSWSVPTFEPGQPADLVVLDLEAERAVQPETFKSKAKFSPWEGLSLKGWPMLTFVRGCVAYMSG
ncbi:MAG: Dihydroorotase [uncultured Truepera sp.]|uniref:Dihydroorotase n=1 Tax=uncultured Truepera sp. TaxID=543023 RepID=A0A6J4VWM3_9DEIN|nr:MAG: Dihydroorotase [uncultured Truepera sp.]